MTKCSTCGIEYGIGDWPWCPHGDGRGFGEEPLEPYLDEHLTSEVAPDESDMPYGIEMTTRSQRRKIMDRNELEYRPKVKVGTLFFDMGKRG
jgi:hypothetical protein